MAKTFAQWSIQIKLLETGITGTLESVDIPNPQIVTPAPSIINMTLPALQPDKKMFILSSETQDSGSRIGDGSVWVDHGAQSISEINEHRFNGALVEGMSDENGVFANPIVITLTGLDMIGAVFFFGTDEWPTEAIFNGQIIFNNSPKWFIQDAFNPGSIKTITFTKWNKPGRPFRVRGVMADFSQEYGEERIQELILNDAPADNDLYVGVKSGRIRIRLLDINGEFKSLRDADLLTSGITLVTKFNGEDFSYHRMGSWNYADEDQALLAEGEQRVINELDREIEDHIVTGTIWDLYNAIKSYDPNSDIHVVPAYLQNEWQSDTINPTNIGGKLLDIWNRFLRSTATAMIDECYEDARRIRFEKEPSLVAFNGIHAKLTDGDATEIQSNILFENTYEALSWRRDDRSVQNVGVGNPVNKDIGFITPKDVAIAKEIVADWDRGKLAVNVQQVNPETFDEDDVKILSWEDGEVIPLLQPVRVWNRGAPMLTRLGDEVQYIVVNRTITFDGGMRVSLVCRQR